MSKEIGYSGTEMQCKTCQEVKPFAGFEFRKDTNAFRKQCKACVCAKAKTRMSAWQKANRDKTRKAGLKFYNSAKGQESSKEYYEKNKESICNRTNANAKTTHGKIMKARAAHRRRISLKSAVEKGNFLIQQWFSLLDKCNNECQICRMKKKLVIDHIIPISKGGSNDISNIQPLCVSCNCKKGNKILINNPQYV